LAWLHVISLRDMGVEEVRSQESGARMLRQGSALISLRDMGVGEVRSQEPECLLTEFSLRAVQRELTNSLASVLSEKYVE
jgi:hypothetical protein